MGQMIDRVRCGQRKHVWRLLVVNIVQSIYLPILRRSARWTYMQHCMSGMRGRET